jgi:hypothetical protein
MVPSVLDKAGGQLLGRRHERCPRVLVAEQGWCGVQREVGRRHVREIGPCDGEGHRRAGPQPRAVRRGNAGATGAGGVEKDLPLPVSLEEDDDLDVVTSETLDHFERLLTAASL